MTPKKPRVRKASKIVKAAKSSWKVITVEGGDKPRYHILK